MSCNALNQSKAKICINWKKCNKKKYKILVIRDLKRLLRIQDYSRAGRCFSYKISGYFFRFFFLPST